MPVITLEQVKNWLRIPLEDTRDDFTLQIAIDGTISNFEAYAGTSLLHKTYAEKQEGGVSYWYTYHRPIVSVTSIADPAGNVITSDRYLIEGEFGLINSYGLFPTARRTDGARDRWLVTYVSGVFATEAAVEANFKVGALLIIAKLFHNPEPQVQSRTEGKSTTSYIPNPSSKSFVPPEVEAYWSPWRSRAL